MIEAWNGWNEAESMSMARVDRREVKVKMRPTRSLGHGKVLGSADAERMNVDVIEA